MLITRMQVPLVPVLVVAVAAVVPIMDITVVILTPMHITMAITRITLAIRTVVAAAVVVAIT